MPGGSHGRAVCNSVPIDRQKEHPTCIHAFVLCLDIRATSIRRRCFILVQSCSLRSNRGSVHEAQFYQSRQAAAVNGGYFYMVLMYSLHYLPVKYRLIVYLVYSLTFWLKQNSVCAYWLFQVEIPINIICIIRDQASF